MLKKLPNLFYCLLAVCSVTAVKAQDYAAMPIASGFNADVIANGVGLANTSTTHTVDADDYVYMANNFQQTASSPLPSIGLPSSGTFTSAAAATPGLPYQLGPLSGNNALRLDNTSGGTLTFATPIQVATLYMLGATGNGPASVTGQINFSDGTSQAITTTAVPDWFNITTPPPAISGFGRLGRTTNTLESPSGNPRLYQIAIAITAANQVKNVVSVQLTKTTAGGVISIFAFSADKYVSCKPVTNLAAVPTMDGATVTWTAPSPAPASGYEYVISTSATAPSITATPTGTVAAGVTTATVTGLIPGVFYYIWVRANCGGGDKGSWRSASFYAGQVSFTYTTGDISTLFNTAPTATSTTTCPGVMSITVPAGYKIRTIGTTYNMLSAGGTFMNEQASLLYCTTSNTGEAAVSFGVGGSGGTYTFNRNDIPIANNLTGTVNFELRAWRTWGGSGCTTANSKVVNNTWKIHAVLESLTCTTPATPSSSAQTMCPSALFSETVINAIPGAVYKWYTQPTGGTALLATDQISTGTFYLTQTVGTCESARSAGFVITASGTANPVASVQTLCGGSTVNNLVATGSNLKWYASLTGGSPLAPSTALATGNYYVSQTLNNCESARTTVAVTINTTPPPTVTEQIFCAGSGATVANLQAGLVAGGTVKWYTSDTATTPLTPTTVLGSGTYYATQTVGVCESVRVASAVAVATIVPPASDPVEVCAGTTVADLVGNGSPSATYKWFDTQASTTPLAPTTLVVSGTYFVTQTINTCESPKAAVVITVNDIAAPVIEAQEFCSGAHIADIEATPAAGATIKWYATETSTTALISSTVLESGTYYASQKLNDCESDRTAVEVTVFDVVPAITATTTLACIGSTIGDLTVEGSADGAVLKWFANIGSINPIAAETTVTPGTYYVSQTVGTCESARSAVAVSFNVIPLPTTENLAVCTGTTFAELPVEGEEGATFNWYNTIDEDDMIDSSEIVSAGTFYVSQTVDGCEGGRAAVAVSTIFTLSPAPTYAQAFCGEATVADLVSGANEGYTVNWYSPEGELLTSDAALVTGIYTVTQTANGCESEPVSVSVIGTGIPDAPTGATEQDFDAGETAADLEVEFAEGTTVEWFFLDEDVWIAIPETTPLIDGAVYGVQQNAGTCESELLAITVNLIEVVGNEEFEISHLNIYPNPSSDVINIEGRETLSEIVVINLLGQKVLSNKVNAASAQINISALPEATYILQVYGANGATASYKIVKQ